MPETPEYLSVADAAAHLRLSARRVERILRDGRLAGRRIGAARVVPRAALGALTASSAPALRAEILEAPLFTLDEAAEAARIDDVAGLRNRIEAGEIPALRIGRSLRLTLSTVARLAADGGRAGL